MHCNEQDTGTMTTEAEKPKRYRIRNRGFFWPRAVLEQMFESSDGEQTWIPVYGQAIEINAVGALQLPYVDAN